MDNKFNLICARLIEDISGLIMKDFAFEMFCRDLNCWSQCLSQTLAFSDLHKPRLHLVNRNLIKAFFRSLDDTWCT